MVPMPAPLLMPMTYYSNQQPSFTTTTDPYGAKLCHRECSGTESSHVWSPDCLSFQTGISNTCLHHCWPATYPKGECEVPRILVVFGSLSHQGYRWSHQESQEDFFIIKGQWEHSKENWTLSQAKPSSTNVSFPSYYLEVRTGCWLIPNLTN